MLPTPIHVAGLSNPLLTPGCAAVNWGFMKDTLTGVGLLQNGCCSDDKGQVSVPSAALIGRANCDPSPMEHQLGQSIVSNRVPAFRVTSPSPLLLLPQLVGGAAGSFSSMSRESIPSQCTILLTATILADISRIELSYITCLTSWLSHFIETFTTE